MTPEPGSAQIREQQVLPLEHGLPSALQPVAPLPDTVRQNPAVPEFSEQEPPQHSLSLKQTSPLAWQV